MKPGIVVLLLLPVVCQSAEIRAEDAALAAVKRIYVDQLGGGKTSDQFRDMLIAAIQNSGLFALTENPERADATLKGSGDDLIFNETHNTSDSLGVHASSGGGSSSRDLNSGTSSSSSLGLGVTDSETSHVQERRHEATGSVRLVDRVGDILWSATQESNGGKYRGAMADVADKLVRQLTEQTRHMRELAAKTPAPPVATLSANPKPAPNPTK